jgi:hypothetical protein
MRALVFPFLLNPHFLFTKAPGMAFVYDAPAEDVFVLFN